MIDHNGNVVVYIGQPWCNPEGTLVEEYSGRFVIQVGDEKAIVSKEGYCIATISYEVFKLRKEGYHDVPKEKEELFDRFEIMDFE